MSTGAGKSPDARAVEILDFMREREFDLATFFVQVMKGDALRLKQAVGGFFGRGGFRLVFESMLPHLSWYIGKRNTKRSLVEMNKVVGVELWKIVAKILGYEIDAFCKGPEGRLAAQDMSPKVAEEFNFNNLGDTFERLCPRLSTLIQSLSGEGETEEGESVEMSDGVLGENNRPLTTAGGGAGAKRGGKQRGLKRRVGGDGDGDTNSGSRKKRKGRDRKLMSTVVLGILIFGHSRRANLMQTVMGYFLEGYGVSKDVVSVFNCMGVCVSYQSVLGAMKGIAENNKIYLQGEIRRGRAYGFAFDNCALWRNVTGQSLLNQKRMEQYTAGMLWFLFVPVAETGGEDVDWQALGVDGKIGLERKVMLREHPDYTGIDDYWVLSCKSLASYTPARNAAHLVQILNKYVPDILRTFADRGETHLVPELEAIYRIPVNKTELHAFATMKLDETKNEDTAKILDEIQVQTGVNKYELYQRGVVVAGDLKTLSNIQSVQGMRVRDFPENRHDYLLRHEGVFHMEMAAEDALMRAHWGREDGMDPGSLCHLKHVLNVRGLSGKTPEYNTCKRFTRTCADAFALAAFCEVLGACDFEDMKSKLQERGEYLELVQEVLRMYFTPRTVRIRREMAAKQAAREWEDMRKLKPRTKDRVGVEKVKRQFLTERSRKQRDVIFENFVLFLQHSFGVRDLHYNVRVGDSGAFLKNVEQWAVWFYGCGKYHYGRLMLNLMIDRKAVWTPTMEWVYLNNIFLNPSGRANKFMGIDKVNELVVRKIKDQHNPRGSWQSEEFFTETISRNILLFNNAKKSVKESTGAINFGSKHSEVSDMVDVMELLRVLMRARIGQYQKGRCTGGSNSNPVEVREALDMYQQGERELSGGKVLSRVMRDRKKGFIDLSGEEEMDEYEEGGEFEQELDAIGEDSDEGELMDSGGTDRAIHDENGAGEGDDLWRDGDEFMREDYASDSGDDRDWD